MNKLEQVSSDGHQMSLAGRGFGPQGVLSLMSLGEGGRTGFGVGGSSGLMCRGDCTVRSNASWVMVT